MTTAERAAIEIRIVEVLKTVYDPEIPVDIYNLGLIYKIDLHDDGTLDVDMTLTAPGCPMAEFIVDDVQQRLDTILGVQQATVHLVFEPQWDMTMMSPEARVELGLD